MERQLWRHVKHGELYIVEVEGDALVAAGGPFPRSQLARLMREGFVSDPALLERLQRSLSGFRRLDWYESMLARCS